jgi:hypothetical protein
MSENRGFAAHTEVPVERTRAEIDALLVKNGATSTAILNDTEHHLACFAFTLKGARYRVELPLPTTADVAVKKGQEPQGWWRWSPAQREDYLAKKLEQARRQRWRTMLLLLKSKLEIVRLGLSSVEREFMADLILPGGKTAYEALADGLRCGLGSDDASKLLLPGATA